MTLGSTMGGLTRKSFCKIHSQFPEFDVPLSPGQTSRQHYYKDHWGD
jgi:hypothetical protein